MVELVQITNKEVAGLTKQEIGEYVIEKINRELNKNKATENKNNYVTNWVLPGENWEANPYVLRKKDPLLDGNIRLMAIYIRKAINQVRDILIENKNDWKQVDNQLLESLKTIQSWDKSWEISPNEIKETALTYRAWGLVGYQLIEELNALLETQKMDWADFNEYYRTKYAFNFQEYLDGKNPTVELKTKLKEIIINPDTPNKEKIKELRGDKLNLSEYPNLEKLVIEGECLRGGLTSLDLSKCSQLIHLSVSHHQLVNLDLTNCPNLKEFNGDDNLLNSLDLSQNSKLEELNIISNNLIEQDLSLFHHLIYLKNLRLGKNRFSGSLENLKNMTNLAIIDISNTDIDSGLEYLPSRVSEFYCSSEARPNSKVSIIAQELRNFGEPEASGNFARLLTDWKKANHNRLIIEKLEKKIQEKDGIISQLKEQIKKLEWENLLILLKTKLNEDGQEYLKDLLEAQAELSENDIPFVQKQLKKSKSRLSKYLNEEEIKTLLDKQINFALSENKSEENLQSQIEIPVKK